MGKRSALLAIVFLFMLAPLGNVVAKDDGMFNKSNGCGCHGGTGVTAQLSGLPSAYVATTTYSLTVAMSGTPNTGGFNLEVNRGALSNPDVNSQVSSNGFQATHGFSPGTTSWTMDWTAPTTGSGNVQFDLAVLAANGNGGTSGDNYGTFSTSLAEDVPSNVAPTATNVAIAPTNPTTSDALTVTYTFNDDDGDGESGTTVSWYRNGNLQSSHTGLTLPSTATSKGESWFASVLPSDGTNTGAAASSASLVIENSAPTVTGVLPSSEAPDTIEDVTFTYQTDDVDGDTVSQAETRWRLDNALVSSLENATTLPAVATRPGDVWEIEVRVSDGTDFSTWFTSPSIVIGSSNQPPVISEVILSSTAAITTLDDIIATWSESDPDGDVIDGHEIIWSKNGQTVAQAEGMNPLPATFTTKGEQWSVSVRAWDGEAWSPWTSSPTLTVANAAPEVLSVDLTSPSFSALHNLSVNLTSSDVDGDQVQLTQVQWFLNGAEQLGLTNGEQMAASELTRGDALHAVVTISDGTDEAQATTPSVVIVNAAPTVSILWAEETNALTDLIPTISVDDADGDDTTYTTVWFKNGFRDANLANSSSVSSEKLAPEQTWRLVVVADDGSETSAPVEATTTLVNQAPNPVIEVVSSDVWLEEATVLSAEASTDADGSIVAYRWMWEGGAATGERPTVVIDEATTITLTITDSNGAEANTTVRLEPTAGPSVQNLQAVHDGRGQVTITWTWTGNDALFNVLRNGELVVTTTAMTHVDLPLMSGLNTYTVQPFNEERTFLKGTSEVALQVDDVVIEQPEPATGLGYGLGGSMVFLLILLQFMMRRGGERR
ncbi:MAG: hypothetical protein CMA15_05045 [Euryarchaeota archaeon]|nr:hypothetical protein [Euryarchaeota archaeon]